ncbi:MAG: hypothetical protein JNK82_40010 [Myxococcaceae bacterium]|nr:hypothetical protein [Myxococcaceae bacterium]
MLLRTQSFVVTRHGSRLVVARRSVHLALAFALIGAIDALLWGAHALAARYDTDGFDALTRWAAIAVACALGLLPLAALWLLAQGPVILDAASRTLRHRRRTYPFDALSAPRIEPRSVAGVPLHALVVDARGRPLELVQGVPPEHAKALDAVHAAVRELLGGLAAGTAPAAPVEDLRIGPLILLAVGLIWSAAGWLAAPDLLLTNHDRTVGFVFWPIGLWVAGAGAVELAGLRVLSRLAGQPRIVQALAGIAWLTPYFLLFTRF